MAVRNFWVDVTVDGRETVLSGGPRAKDGGMRAVFYIRDAGSIAKALTVDCYTGADGLLKLAIQTDGQQNGYKVMLQGNGSIAKHIVTDDSLIMSDGQVKECILSLTTIR